jgi:hypothetical protein
MRTQLRKVERIVTQDPERRVVVVSAPANAPATTSRSPTCSIGVTIAFAPGTRSTRSSTPLPIVYRSIIRELGLAIDLDKDLAGIHDGYRAKQDARLRRESRGIPQRKDCREPFRKRFVDAAEIIRFDSSGRLFE